MRARGFTLIEMAVTILVIGIAAAMTIPVMRAAVKNATVVGVGFDLKIKLEQLRARAMRDQRELVAVIVDARENEPRNCAGDDCASFYVLHPLAGFQLNAFDPAEAIEDAEHVDHERLGNGIKLYLPASGRAAPTPFTNVLLFDGPGEALLGNCGGHRRCVGFRFLADGSVQPEPPTGGAVPSRLGLAFAIGSDIDEQSSASAQRGVLVAFPSGLVRVFPVAR